MYMVSMVIVYNKESHGHKVIIVQFSQKFKCLRYWVGNVAIGQASSACCHSISVGPESQNPFLYAVRCYKHIFFVCGL